MANTHHCAGNQQVRCCSRCVRACLCVSSSVIAVFQCLCAGHIPPHIVFFTTRHRYILDVLPSHTAHDASLESSRATLTRGAQRRHSGRDARLSPTSNFQANNRISTWLSVGRRWSDENVDRWSSFPSEVNNSEEGSSTWLAFYSQGKHVIPQPRRVFICKKRNALWDFTSSITNHLINTQAARLHIF